MNKQDLIKDISERGEFTKADAEAALKAVQGAIIAALAAKIGRATCRERV